VSRYSRTSAINRIRAGAPTARTASRPALTRAPPAHAAGVVSSRPSGPVSWRLRSPRGRPKRCRMRHLPASRPRARPLARCAAPCCAGPRRPPAGRRRRPPLPTRARQRLPPVLHERVALGRARSGRRGDAPSGRSGREPRPTLRAAPRDDGAPGAGAHSRAEAVRLRPAAVVRLKRPLRHRVCLSLGRGLLDPAPDKYTSALENQRPNADGQHVRATMIGLRWKRPSKPWVRLPVWKSPVL
jgi:hypothetical protein